MSVNVAMLNMVTTLAYILLQNRETLALPKAIAEKNVEISLTGLIVGFQVSSGNKNTKSFDMYLYTKFYQVSQLTQRY